ncbi:TetR/AcrR family transcriptional regulator [Amylibacter sp.]|jgi:AcrR family transcriptional regulator|nr:TetR family transcriptional regulator [Amylibacter sp.]MDB9857878.1 TetR/AcrR family transcriptional regulator [Amylibacter sp.]
MARKSGSSSEKTRPLVRSAALSLFARYGFAAVSMRQIAAEVGVQAGALYRYTPDKQSLLFELMQVHMEELLAAWGEVDPKGAPLDRLDSFVRFHIHHHMDRAEAVFISYMELRNLTPANFAVIEGLRAQYEQVLEEILNACGAAAGDRKLTTLAVLAMLTGVNTWYREGGRLDRDAIADSYVGMVRGLISAAA